MTHPQNTGRRAAPLAYSVSSPVAYRPEYLAKVLRQAAASGAASVTLSITPRIAVETAGLLDLNIKQAMAKAELSRAVAAMNDRAARSREIWHWSWLTTFVGANAIVNAAQAVGVLP